MDSAHTNGGPQADSIIRETGNGGLERITLRHDSGSALEVYSYGAHITSFRSPVHGEILYLSPTAEFRLGKAIRGGVPLIFPQFGPGPLPSHGFARNSLWTVISSGTRPGGEVWITFGLRTNDETKKIWPFEFACEFEIRLSAALSTSLRVENRGKERFSFQSALHTYFAISEVSNVLVKDLSGLMFLDNTMQRTPATESRSSIPFQGEIDRIYLATPSQLTIEDAGLKRKILIRKQGLPDAVVWNPWIEKGKSFKDLEPDGYKKFVCVETGAIEPPTTLAPGERFEGLQEIWIQPL